MASDVEPAVQSTGIPKQLMNAALLCPGPSLCETWNGHQYDLTIAVNRAILFHPADWWMATDHKLILRTGPIAHRPKYCTSNASMSSICRRGRLDVLGDGVQGLSVEDHLSVAKYEPPYCWRMYSATTALVLAHHLGAKTLSVYGADMKGEQDWDGDTHESNNRNDKRWESESVIWNKTADMLERKGTEVRRILWDC